MISPLEFYNQELSTHKISVDALKKRLLLLSTCRLLIFASTTFGIYITYTNWQLAIIVGVIGAVLFIYTLSKYTDCKSTLHLSKALIHINEEELKIASGDYFHRDSGLQFQDPNHYYSLDIDLFGKGSLFQYLNRANSLEGKSQLSEILKANDIKNIEARQRAIKELSEKTEWTQRFSASESLIKTEYLAVDIIHWLHHYKSVVPTTLKWMPLLFSIVSIGLLGLVIGGLLNVSYFGYWLFVGLGFTGLYLKKINVLAANAERGKQTFRQYASLLSYIETETFTSELLIEKQELIQSEGKKASTIFREFSKHLDALDNRNNLIGAIFGNGYLLSDIRNAGKVEKWIRQYNHKVEDWFNVVCFFEAFNSLGNYAFNHPNHAFPKLSNSDVLIDAKQLGHPLLNAQKRVSSDVRISNEQFFIVTGANMAGKSTFLRTVALHIVMANVGLPVCADSSVYKPVKLITSMRTNDSLADESSYFFSELTRLKFIVDTVEKEPYLIVLDEILKGTNSTDKAIGSRKFIEKLVSGNATGIIATHDLSLCEIEEELSAVKNYYFDAQIVNDELYFDYKFKQGICQNMNASFLLQKMRIV